MKTLTMFRALILLIICSGTSPLAKAAIPPDLTSLTYRATLSLDTGGLSHPEIANILPATLNIDYVDSDGNGTFNNIVFPTGFSRNGPQPTWDTTATAAADITPSNLTIIFGPSVEYRFFKINPTNGTALDVTASISNLDTIIFTGDFYTFSPFSQEPATAAYALTGSSVTKTVSKTIPEPSSILLTLLALLSLIACYRFADNTKNVDSACPCA